jgi:dienelactone hydrolase
MRRIGLVIATVLGAVALVASLVGLARAQDGGTVRASIVDGIPVALYSTGELAPTIVVAHGFSGSAQIMDPLARGLMRAGFTVVTFDFPGHGANATPLSAAATDRESDGDVLERALDDVLGWAVKQPEVDRERLALLGHSMGAGAVVQYAADGAAVPVRATVTLSLPSADRILPGQALVPPNLLLLFGSLEDSRFSDAALQGVQAAYPDAVVGQQYGDATAGTAREAQAIPGVEHIGILFSQSTLDATVAWLGPALGVEPAAASIAPVLLWALLALLAGGLLLAPLGRAVLGAATEGATAGIRGREVLAVVTVASLVASVAARLLMPLSDRIPLAVGGYVATWFLVSGAVVVGCWVWRWRAASGWPAITARSAAGALAATALASAVVVVPGSMSWAPFAVVGARGWLLPVVALAFAAYFAADELLVRRPSLPRRLGLALASRLIAVAVILVSIPLLGAPGFLILLLPLMVLFLVVLAGYAAVVSRFRNGYLAAVLVQAVPLALLVATTFPLVAPD